MVMVNSLTSYLSFFNLPTIPPTQPHSRNASQQSGGAEDQ